MFEPGVCSEGLNEAALFGGILEYTPVVCSISAARTRIFRKRAQKLVTTLRIDAVFDRHQHRSSIGLDRSSRDRIRPMHRRRKVDVDARLQLPAPREWNRYARADGCDDKSGGQPSDGGNLAPQ